MAVAKHNRISGETQVTRRRLLTAASAVVAVGAVPAIATAATAEALTIPERFALLSPEDQALVLAEMDRLELARETPVAALFREWQAAKEVEEAAYEACPDDDDKACDAAWNARYAVEKRMMEAPCETPRDWLLKSCAWANFGDGNGPDRVDSPQLWAEARALVGA